MSFLGFLGGVAALGSTITGAVKSVGASNSQRRVIDRMEAENDAWYNKEYYQDYMNRSDAQAAMKRVRDFMQRRGRQADASAAITGATPESIVAARAADNQVISDTAAGIQANADAYRDGVRRTYLNQKQAIIPARMGLHQAEAAMGGQLMGAGFDLGTSLLTGGIPGGGQKNELQQKGGQ